MDESTYPKNDELNHPTRAENVFGMFKTSDQVPTGTPKNWFDQILIYKNGATLRLYWYDVTNAGWHYVTATA